MSIRWRRTLAVLVLALLGGLGITAAEPRAYASELDFFGRDHQNRNDEHVAHYQECRRFWPSSGQFETFQLSPTDYAATIRFQLLQNELKALQCLDRHYNAPYLEIDFNIEGFDVPAEWEGYRIVATNLPEAMHDVAKFDSEKEVAPAVTNISIAKLEHSKHYFASLKWNAPLQPGSRPQVSIRWVPSHWAQGLDQLAFCEVVMGRAPSSLKPPWCIFSRSRIFLSYGYYPDPLPFDGLRVFPFPSTVAAKSHHSLGTTIVRNPVNESSWLVDQDGHRRWIPTGGDYLCFTAQGYRVLNLPQSSIDVIPDRVGTHAKCTPQRAAGGSTSGPTTPSRTSPTTGPGGSPSASLSGRYGMAWLQGSTLLKFGGPDLSTVGSVGGIGRPDWASAGDYNKDGKEDLFWYHGGNDGSIYALVSTSTSFKSKGRIRGPGVGKPRWAGVGDFNGDGYRNEIAWLEGTTLFMFSGQTLSTISATPGIGAPDWAGVGDYDGDGKDDLFWFHGGTDGSIYGLRSDGNKFSSIDRIRGPGLGTPNWAGVGDFNGDGQKNDIAWHQGDKLLTFCGQHLVNCGNASGIASPTWAGVASWGGDHRDGLLWFHGGADGSFYKLEMRPGTNNFRSMGRVRGPGIGTPLVAVGGVF